MAEKIKDFFVTCFDTFYKYVISVIPEIGIRDIVDILLLAMILFFVYRFIHERRAGRLARGLLLVVAVMIFSMLFDLRALKFIVGNFYQVGLIAIIVIFQSDLRAALERFGTTSIKNFRNMTATDYKDIVEMADILSETTDALARERTGALIVLERTTKLGEYMEQGVILNADMSSPLLRNIFVNRAPLHDGAVIIRNRRIHAAGCYLPSSTADLNKDLGTRHRAAVGLSEVSDAVVIVVSEETGTISIAVDGDLQRNFNYSSLKQTLLKYLLPADLNVAEDGKGKRINRKKKGKTSGDGKERK